MKEMFLQEQCSDVFKITDLLVRKTLQLIFGALTSATKEMNFKALNWSTGLR